MKFPVDAVVGAQRLVAATVTMKLGKVTAVERGGRGYSE